MSIRNTISFYWKAQFKDGFTLSQFEDDGEENFIKDYLSDELKARRNSKPKLSIIGKNVFSKLEESHGKVKKFGWYPFEHDLANAVRNRSENHIAEVKEKPVEIKVPEDCYPNFFRTSSVTFGQNIEPKKQDSELAISLIKRENEKTHVHATKYDKNDKLIEEKHDNSFDSKNLNLEK